MASQRTKTDDHRRWPQAQGLRLHQVPKDDEQKHLGPSDLLLRPGSRQRLAVFLASLPSASYEPHR